MIDIRVGETAFDASVELDRLQIAGVGAIASFIGVVRGDGELVSMTLDHYPAMTVQALRMLADEATERWSLSAAIIVHRVGTLVPGERIVFVGTAAPHRAAALEGCAFLIDALKTKAPFWKQETFADGRAEWVDARDTDNEAVVRWDQTNAR